MLLWNVELDVNVVVTESFMFCIEFHTENLWWNRSWCVACVFSRWFARCERLKSAEDWIQSSTDFNQMPLNITINWDTPHHNTKNKDITQYLHCQILLENLILLQPQYIKLLIIEEKIPIPHSTVYTLPSDSLGETFPSQRRKYTVRNKTLLLPTTPTIFLRFNMTAILAFTNYCYINSF